MKNGIFFFLFGCDCGDLKSRDFWDFMFSRGLDVEFGACLKKLPFWLGLTEPVGPDRGRSQPREKNLFSKRAESRSWVLAHESGLGMQKSGLNPARCPKL